MENKSSIGRVPAVDGFRVLALFGVVTAHILGTAGVMGKYFGTNEGVVLWGLVGNNIDFFFIISGFVLFLPAVKRGGEFGSKARFWVARGARLLPAYWLVLLLCLFLIAVSPPAANYPFPGLESIAAHFTSSHLFFRMFIPGDLSPGFGLVGPVWMLTLIVTFYVLLPFIAKGYFRHPFIGLGIATAVTVGWKLIVNHSPQFFDRLSDGSQEPLYPQLIALDQFPGWAFSFGLGMTGAWLYVWARQRYDVEQLARFAIRVAPLVVLLYVYAAYEYGSTTLVFDGRIGPVARTHIFETMLGNFSRAALIGVIITGPLWLQRPFANTAIHKLAEWSYGVYLIHILLVVYAVSYLNLPRDGSIEAFLTWAVAIVPASIVWAYLSRRFVEVPVRRWVESRAAARWGWGRREPAAPVPAPE